jgi:hypothetical protein
MSTVAATTEEIKTSTKYTYDYTRLPPLAMAGVLPDVEAFSARPDWIHLVARSALKILINTIMIGVKNTGDNIKFVQQVLENIQAVAQQLDGEAGRDLNNAIAMALEKQGSPTTLPQLKALLEVVIEPLAQTLNLKTLGHRSDRSAVGICFRSRFQPRRLQPSVSVHFIAGGQPEFSRGFGVCRHAGGWAESVNN